MLCLFYLKLNITFRRSDANPNKREICPPPIRERILDPLQRLHSVQNPKLSADPQELLYILLNPGGVGGGGGVTRLACHLLHNPGPHHLLGVSNTYWESSPHAGVPNICLRPCICGGASALLETSAKY